MRGEIRACDLLPALLCWKVERHQAPTRHTPTTQAQEGKTEGRAALVAP